MMRATLLDGDLLASPRLARPSGGRQVGVANIALGHPGRCPLRPTHLTLAFDNSGSVGSVGGNDPIGNRFAEARLAIEAVGRRCRCSRELISVLHFDFPTSLDLLAVPLSRHRSQIER